jgi:hypothetical protein
VKRTTRRVGAAVVAACGSLLLSACNAHPGHAAFVGNSAISTSTLQGIVSRSLSQSDCGKTYANRPVVLERAKLTSLIKERLLQQVADRLHVSVSDADVAAELRKQSDVYGGQRVVNLQASRVAAVAPQDVTDAVRTSVLQTKVEDALTARIPTSDAQLQQFYNAHLDTYLEGHARDMVLTDKATADSIVAQVKANPDSFGSLLRTQAERQQAEGKRGDPQSTSVLGPFVGLNPKSVVDAGGYIGLVPLSQLKAAGFSIDPGSVFAVQLSNGWNVVQILDRLSFQDVKQQVRRDALSQQRQQALDRALNQQVKRTPITVNPRFGTWNGKLERVVPASGGVVATKGESAATLSCGQGQGSAG